MCACDSERRRLDPGNSQPRGSLERKNRRAVRISWTRWSKFIRSVRCFTLTLFRISIELIFN
jgi:hypothetical protein